MGSMGQNNSRGNRRNRKMMKGINIVNLPDLALQVIAKYLEPKDIIHMAEASPCFEDMRRFLPKYQEIIGQEFEKREVVIKDHPVVEMLKRGDKLRFMRNVGGGGGHSLHVRQFKVVIELKKY